MRISDWSSDVCSSDLYPEHASHGRTFRALRKSGCLHCRHPKHLPRSALTSLQLAFSGWHMWNVRAAQGQTRCLLEEKKGHCADHAGAHHGIGGHEGIAGDPDRSEEHTSELQSLMR